ncbi:uncharacterized protein LOC116172042 [Photinus pyralis]|uniref:uncharacterized protein LOC116172042 n=1 Tax=Photinus pyralis TaxID=7054 RepID=UPI0012672EAD|nr:uncharacterized protein LOC116172042 [Photinus pyralis]
MRAVITTCFSERLKTKDMFQARLPTGLFAISSIYLLLFLNHSQNANSFVSALNNMEALHRPHRPLPAASARLAIHYKKVHPELSDILDEEDLFDLSKRLVTDDYGHLRFGKRGEDFDDYGHLRFGRGGTENK